MGETLLELGWGCGVGWGVVHFIDAFLMCDRAGKRNGEKDGEDVAALSSPSSHPTTSLPSSGYICARIRILPYVLKKTFLFGVQQNKHFNNQFDFLCFQ